MTIIIIFLAAPSSCLQADKYTYTIPTTLLFKSVSREKKSMWIYKLISLEQKKGGGGKKADESAVYCNKIFCSWLQEGTFVKLLSGVRYG